ncbi:MAG: ABC transporter permease [Synergistetes bacterium]|nr:ABC transporter permease [Synergistota bacterium]
MNRIVNVVKSYGIYFALLTLVVVFSFASEWFFTVDNLMDILVQSSLIAIAAVGQTFVILTGGIDLSVGSVVAFSSICTGMMLVSGIPIPLVIILGSLIGTLYGLVNGVLISYGKIPAFIVTLGAMSIARGGALALNSGRPISGFPPGFEKIASYSVGGIPVFVFYTLIVYVIGLIVMYKLKAGRYLFAIGGNKQATRLAGINVRRYETFAYVVAGLLSGLVGVLLTARLNYATPLSGEGYELDTIAAAVIGGTSLSGGEGGLIGTLVGALLLGTLKDGLTLLNVVSYYQEIIIGSVIIGAVFYERAKKSGE